MSDSRSGTTPESPHATAHPRFAEALTAPGPAVEVRGFPGADVRERTA
ncbi:hypothetical protein ACFW81_29770 [Streptomyces angustmyceticus]